MGRWVSECPHNDPVRKPVCRMNTVPSSDAVNAFGHILGRGCCTAPLAPLAHVAMASGGTVMHMPASDMAVACTDDRTALLTPLVHATASSESGRLNGPPPWRTRPRPKMGQHAHHDGGGLNAVRTHNPNSFSRCFQKRLFAEPLRQLNNCSSSEVLQHGPTRLFFSVTNIAAED